MRKRVTFLILLLLLAAMFCGCDSAFAPDERPSDGDVSDGDADSDRDAEIDEEKEAEDDGEIAQYNLRIRPQFAYRGDTLREAKIKFENVETIREILADGDPAFKSWQLEFGDGIDFVLVRFDEDNLEFYDMEFVVSATARTGEREVWTRITYGDATVREYGLFYVFDADSAQGPATDEWNGGLLPE